MTDITLPIRVRVSDGARLTPRGNAHEDSVWCEGAADTVTRKDRIDHAEKINDLREKRKVLESKRPTRAEA